MYPNVDWIDEVYKSFSSVTNAHLNVTGGSEKVRYYVSASFYDQEGQYKVKKMNGYNPNLSYRRYDFRSNVDANLTRSTVLQLNISALLVDAKYPGISSGNLWYHVLSTSPVAFPVRYPDGRWAGPKANSGVNPLDRVQNTGYSNVFKPTVQSVFTLNQKLDFLTEGLSAYARFSFDSYGQFVNRRSGQVDLWNAEGRDGEGNLIFGNPTLEGTQFLNYTKESNGEYVLYFEGNVAYDRTFGDHSVSGMLLYNMRNRRVSTAGDAVSAIPYRNQAIAGRLSYGFRNKYLLEVNASYTGSENFAPGHRFGFFPAISGGWVISNEGFFDGARDVVNLLKLRASYGLVGNDNIGAGGRFGYLTQIVDSNGYGFGENGSWVNSIKTSVVGTDNLTWEKSYKTNLGLELGLWDKISLTADFFMETRKDILISRASIPDFSGFSGMTIYANMGEMDNKGFDANIEYNDRFGDFGLRLYGNISYTNNKIVFQDEAPARYDYMMSTGTQFGEFKGYIAEGLFVDDEQIAHSPKQFGITPKPGDIKYKDLNNDGVIDAYDQTYLGKSWFPAWSYGVGFNLNWEEFRPVSLLPRGSRCGYHGQWFGDLWRRSGCQRCGYHSFYRHGTVSQQCHFESQGPLDRGKSASGRMVSPPELQRYDRKQQLPEQYVVAQEWKLPPPEAGFAGVYGQYAQPVEGRHFVALLLPDRSEPAHVLRFQTLGSGVGIQRRPATRSTAWSCWVYEFSSNLKEKNDESHISNPYDSGRDGLCGCVVFLSR